MAEGRYYWLRLKRDFFKRHDIMVVEALPNGKDYILFYLKLLCESVDHDGRLRFSDSIPYSEDMLATITRTNPDVVRSAVKVFTELGMMEILDDGTMYMTEVQALIGSETRWAEAKRHQRQIVQIGHELDNVQTMSRQCPTEKEKEKEKESEKEKPKAKTPGVGELIEEFSSDEDVRQALKDFVAMRKSIRKPITPRGLRGVLKRLADLSGDPVTQVAILDQSIEHDWQTVYELKGPEAKKRKTTFHNFEERESAGGSWEELETYKPPEEPQEQTNAEFEELLRSFKHERKNPVRV